MTQEAAQAKSDEQTTQYMKERHAGLTKLVGTVIPLLKNAIEQENYGPIDVAQALSIATASILAVTTPPEHLAKVKEEANKTCEEILNTLQEHKIGLGTAMTSQLLAQAKVLAYICEYAALDLYQHIREEADGNAERVTSVTNVTNVTNDAAADQPSERTE